MKLLKVIIPNWYSPEVAYLLLVSLSLIARTFCDVFLIHNGTLIESSIISGNTDLFVKYVSRYVSAMPFVSASPVLLSWSSSFSLKYSLASIVQISLVNNILKVSAPRLAELVI